ncbi:MAG TPA: GNAT family N-acetyltransferase [Candidatus Polarisedimenticolia bacterium]|jgi:ribosomal protein S18 acetylase RimI-like enzyme|nr:GNAT family N-acetyltransferase [Candidatus Polarisedimenticolia bacterium]
MVRARPAAPAVTAARPEPRPVPRPVPRVQSLSRADLAAVARLDALHTGQAKRRYWQEVFQGFVPGGRDRSAGRRSRRTLRLALGVKVSGRLAGYLFGEVRAFEFGSPPCGWIFAVGVDPGLSRQGVASALLEEACARFRSAGVGQVRTMVRRTDVPVLSFFRSRGFVGGPFVQLERDVAKGQEEGPPPPAREEAR